MKWIISLHKGFIKSFMDGSKTIELRTKVPSRLRAGDEIYCVEIASGGWVRLKLRVGDIIASTPDEFFDNYGTELALNYLAYRDYTQGRKYVYGIVVNRVEVVNIPLIYLGRSKAPQWFCTMGS